MGAPVHGAGLRPASRGNLNWREEDAPGSAGAARGRWRPAAPALTAFGSALSGPGPPLSPPALPARDHSFAL